MPTPKTTDGGGWPTQRTRNANPDLALDIRAAQLRGQSVTEFLKLDPETIEYFRNKARERPPVSVASETASATARPKAPAANAAERAGGLEEKPATTLREDIEAASDALARLRTRARREGSTAQLTHLVVAECRLAAALGETEPVTPSRFAKVQHPDYPEDEPMDALDNTQCLNDHPFSGAISAGCY